MPRSEIQAFPIGSKLVDLEYFGFHELLEKENKIIRVSLAAVSVTVVILGLGLLWTATVRAVLGICADGRTHQFQAGSPNQIPQIEERARRPLR
jgi:hypothetical protein